METAVEFLNLRKERGLKEVLDKVVITDSHAVFADTDLEGALRAAGELSLTLKKSVEVCLPTHEIQLDKPLSVPENVTLVGRSLNSSSSSNVDNVSRLRLTAGGSLTFTGKNSRLTNCVIVLMPNQGSSETSQIVVTEGGECEIEDCVVEDEKLGYTVGGSGILALGGLKLLNCLVSNSFVSLGTNSSGKFERCHFVKESVVGVSSGDVLSNSKAAITALNVSKAVELVKCFVSGFSVGLLADKCREVNLAEVTFSSVEVGVDVVNSSLKISDCKLVNVKERCLRVKGSESQVEIANSSLENTKVGIALSDGSYVKLIGCVVKAVSLCGIRVESGAKIEIESSQLNNDKNIETGGSSASSTSVEDGIQVIKAGQVDIKKSSIVGFSGRGLVCQDTGSMLSFEEIEVLRNKLGALLAVDGCKVKGISLTANENEGQIVTFQGEDTRGDLSKVKVNGGLIGLFVSKGPVVKFKECKLEALNEKAIYIFNSFVTVNQAQITQTKTKKLGVHVKFKGMKRNKVTLQDCKAHQCSEGIRVEQINASKDKAKIEVKEESEEAAQNTDSDSRCIIENAAFVQCHTGFYVDAAKVELLGCSFIMNQSKSIIMENHKFKQGVQVRKESNVSIRWPNYVEPYIDNGDSISNDHQLLTSVTKEKSFCGSADFEPIMYISTLTERIRQARTLFRSKEPESMPTARIIMRSVSHMLILLKQLTPRMLDRELNDDPDLGMFAATFKLYKEKNGPSNTLISMQELFDSWKTLHRTRLFDQALHALNEAFNEKQVTEDMYDQWVTPLEEMQRDCFVKSKYNRRRDYLLTTAKETPLTTWYFLEKESERTEEGKKLREEVLQFLAADREEHRSFNKTNFHASWVAQWAIQLLGPKFCDQPIPEDAALRKAWAGSLLDLKNPKRVLDQYDSVTLSNSNEYDELIKFECLKMYETEVSKLNAAQVTKLTSVLGGHGFPAAMKTAARFFLGDGALPGFLRRVAEDAKSPELLLDPLSNINEISTIFTRKQRDKVILAVVSHHILPDSQKPPEGYRRPDKTYETCEMCLVQKLQPWNSVKLDACKHNHRYCKECFKFSMSQGQQQLWGLCPGRADDNTSCGAQATRREMELAGMNNDLIYNILSKRITNLLQAIPGWKPCDAPGCIGGRSNVTKTFYTCRLCNKMITMDNGASDPTVPRRLLQGFDGTTVTRGEGVFRECYFCAVTYEKGNACSTITCSHCNKQFSMTWGPEKITHRFDEEGVPPQRYVPKVEGKLWALGVFKDRKGKPLKLGQTLTEAEAAEVVRRAKLKLVEYTE